MQEMTAFACYCGRKHVVQLLLDHSDPNFDWNARNNDGLIAFILACFNGHIDVVQLLLDLSKFSRLLFNKQHKRKKNITGERDSLRVRREKEKKEHNGT